MRDQTEILNYIGIIHDYNDGNSDYMCINHGFLGKQNL